MTKKISEEIRRDAIIEKLIKEGYVLNDKEKELIDCDSNKEKINKLILDRFPSALIKEWKSRINERKTQQHILRTVKVRIPKVEDIYIVEKTPI